VDLLARVRVADGNHPVSLERRQDRLDECIHGALLFCLRER
jgi:hypothetical protein